MRVRPARADDVPPTNWELSMVFCLARSQLPACGCAVGPQYFPGKIVQESVLGPALA
jgi:hypothetical protein